MGLIELTEGKIFIDDIELSNKILKSWQKKGLIPQDAF